MSDEKEESGRLSRWSQRKLASASGDAEKPADEASSAAQDDVRQEQLDAQLEANRLAAEAVDLESLDDQSDFSIFMKEGVPEFLKKQAMLALWRTNPVFANVDGLVDYGEDYGSSDLLMKTFKSAYQAGRGYLDKIETEQENSDNVSGEQETVAADEIVADNESEPSETEMAADQDRVSTQPAADEDFVDDLIDEEVPKPRVSLRRRLELDIPTVET